MIAALVFGALASGPALAQDIRPAVGNDNPTLAFNLSGVHDYSSGFQFLDLMKTAAPWIGHEPGTWGGKDWFELKDEGYLDADGWLKAIPPGLERVGTIVRFTGIPGNETRKKGVYLLRYEGRGTIRLKQDAHILSQRPGEIRFENREGKTFILDIVETDPEGTGDYIRDMTLIREEHAELFAVGAVFTPDWIARIADARHLRFMTWVKINYPRIERWEEMPSVHGPHSGHGQSLAHMVQLANEVGADPWFTIPHTVDDDYVRQSALYVRDALDPALQVRVEYSNEAWNGAFPVRHWLEDQAKQHWGVERGATDYHVKRATETMRIWEDVFGAEAETRLVKVLGGQAVNTWLTGQLFNAEMWKRFEPDNWTDPRETFDEFAIASYFGGRETVDPEGRADLLAAIEDPEIDANRYVLGLMQRKNHKGSVPDSLRSWRAQARLARRAGLRLVAYEGGQHLHHSFAVEISEEDKQALTAFFGPFVKTPEMAEIYQKAWEAWASVSDGPFMQFVDIGIISKWGSWGLRETLDDENPRSLLLDRLNAQTTPWWNGAMGGEHYQQGITQIGSGQSELLVGTPQEDYLIGKAGDDVFRSGPGDDGLHGGPGTDRALFSGLQAQYTVRPEGIGYRVTGPDGSNFLVDIEEIQFDDTGPLLLDSLTRKADGTLEP